MYFLLNVIIIQRREEKGTREEKVEKEEKEMEGKEGKSERRIER